MQNNPLMKSLVNSCMRCITRANLLLIRFSYQSVRPTRFQCCTQWHQQELWLLLMDEGRYRGEDLGYAVGKEQQTI